MSFVKSKILKQLSDNFPTFLRRDLSKCLDLLFNEIIESLCKNPPREIEIRSFGSFRIRNMKARLGRNPRSGERVEIPAKKTILFRMSRKLLEQVNLSKENE